MEENDRIDPATPTAVRCITSYPARRSFKPGVIYPPQVPWIEGAIDVHCHAHEGQNDPLALAIIASQARMGGLLFKTIGKFTGAYRPAHDVDQVRAGLAKWSESAGIAPTQCWAGYVVGQDNKPPSLEKVRESLADGVAAVWLPVHNHANTLSKVGGKPIWWDRSASPSAHTEPLSWQEALSHGYFLLDDRGRLKPVYGEIIRAVVDSRAALFFGHGTHAEIFAVAELLDQLDFRRSVVDHPFSPFVNLDLPQMRQLVAGGSYLNFTYDELSPLLGVDPARMAEVIRAVGVRHVTLSSDAGEPLFPHTAECIRLIRSYMLAFGMSQDDVNTMSAVNPARILALRDN